MAFFRNNKTKNARTGLISVIDVGTSKICCLIAERIGQKGVKIIGIGYQLSQGVKTGTIVDMEATASALARAVHQAEKMAGVTLRSTNINISSTLSKSQNFNIDMALGGHEITHDDLSHLVQEIRGLPALSNSFLLHTIPINYTLDGQGGIKDPKGMVGDRLHSQFHIISAPFSALRNISNCVERCHLNIDRIFSSALSSGVACLVEDEMNLGTTLIDMGGGTTSIVVFYEGQAVYVDSLPIGGAHVTLDIARGLTTPIVEAERLKTLYGHAFIHKIAENEVIEVPQIGESETNHTIQVPKSYLLNIIQPRLQEIFELIHQKLEASGFNSLTGRRIVLTGGASQLPGMRELAQQILARPVRLAKAQPISGLPANNNNPCFSSAIGMLIQAVDQEELVELSLAGQKSSLLGRISSWVKQNV